MPTEIELIYDALAAKIDGALTGYYRLPNAYDITSSNFLSRSKGYAIACGPGVQTNLQINCSVSWERVFTVTLANRIQTTDNNTELRASVDKDILADHRALLYAFYNDLTLGGRVTDADVIDDGGIDLVGEEQKFLGIELTILVKYEEDLRA